MDLWKIFAVIAVTINCYCLSEVGAKWGQQEDGKKEEKGCENGHCLKQCYPTPHAMEGPFYVPGQPRRSDVTEGREGVPLKLELNIKDYHANCSPVKGVDVHVWQPDALGVYSAYLGYYPLGKPGSKQITGEHAEPTDDSSFLRGVQKTDDQGTATFQTIYPGWYLHRALHIHFKVFINGEDIYTGEVYFPEEITDQVAKVKPYVDSKEERANNDEDWLFVRLDGFRSIANVTGDTEKGFKATLNVVVELPVNEENENGVYGFDPK